MPELRDLVAQRVQEEMDRRDKIRRGTFDELGAIKGILGGPSGSVYSNMQGGASAPPSMSTMAQGGGGEMSPEEYEYLVEIQKRDVYGQPEIDPETGQPMKQKPIGWDKSVSRIAKRRPRPEAVQKEPNISDLTSDGMKKSDRARNSKGQFSAQMSGDIFDFGGE
jgi:hypothetical protein